MTYEMFTLWQRTEVLLDLDVQHREFYRDLTWQIAQSLAIAEGQRARVLDGWEHLDQGMRERMDVRIATEAARRLLN